MIGGEHYLKPAPPVANSMAEMLQRHTGALSCFASGRDALFALVSALPQTSILLPDLICQSVYQACEAAGKTISTYRIGADLVQQEVPVAELGPDSCILVMHYFGIPNKKLVAQAGILGAVVISDVTHMLFNGESLHALSEASDYLVASLRKSAAFPDGGFISSRRYPLVQAGRPCREEFFALRTAGLVSRGFSARDGFADEENFALLKKAESILDQSAPGDYGCSYLSRQLLQTIEIPAAVEQIRKNISTLSHELGAVCQTLNTAVTPSPWFVCMFASQSERDAVRLHLASRRYFCPVHWDTSWLEEPSFLSGLCLSIPCDSRYNEHDMQLVAEEIVSCLNASRLRS